MNEPPVTRGPLLSRGVRLVVGAVPRAVTRARRNPPPEGVTLLALCFASVLLLVLGLVVSEKTFPPVAQVLPLLGGGLLLRRQAMRRLLLVVAVCIVWDVVALGLDATRLGAIVTVVVTGLIALEFARSREETGL